VYIKIIIYLDLVLVVCVIEKREMPETKGGGERHVMASIPDEYLCLQNDF
jgi:hypothetical protein